MRPLARIALLFSTCLSACVGPSAEERALASLRAEHRARERLEAERAWWEATRGLAFEPLQAMPVDPASLSLLSHAASLPGLEPREARALRFLRRALENERRSAATAELDRQIALAEAGATLALDFRSEAPPYRLAQSLLAAEPDPRRRAQIQAAASSVLDAVLNPLLVRRDEEAQRAARDLGTPDLVALAEEEKEIDLRALLAQGARYVRATQPLVEEELERAAREALGQHRSALRPCDLPRLWTSPDLAAPFDRSSELPALAFLLESEGLDLRTAAGTRVRIDEASFPAKRTRAFVDAVDAPADVRLSFKPQGGLADYWTLFHEAGHAVHFASTEVAVPELITLGDPVPGEAFGELFRAALSDVDFLFRLAGFLEARGRPRPAPTQLARVIRRTVLREMLTVRRAAFSQLAFELRLRGRPLADLAPAITLLPQPERVASADDQGLRELYRQLTAVALAVEMSRDDAARFRVDLDPGFFAADETRALVLAGRMDGALTRRFGAGWRSEPRAGRFLRKRFFAFGTALTRAEVAARLGIPDSLDLDEMVAREAVLLRRARSLEAGEENAARLGASATLQR